MNLVMPVISITTALLCAGSLAWNIRQTLRSRREVEQAMLLRQLLRQLCVQAFMLRHAPIWQAWADTMGDIRVSVATGDREPD